MCTGWVVRLRRSQVLLDRSPHQCHPEVQVGPPQVHPRSVRGRRKLAQHRPAGSWFIRGRSLRLAAHAQTSRRRPLPGVVSPWRYRDISTVCRACRRVDPVSRPFGRPVKSGRLAGSSPRAVGHRKPGTSSSVNRRLPLLRPERSAQMRHRAGFMIADAVRYMSVHSWKQPDAWTQRDLTAPKATAREAGNPQLTGRFRR